MEATSLCYLPLSPLPFPSRKSHCRKMGLSGMLFASRKDSYEWDYKGRAVEKSMIVLRKRIHEMKMIERNYEPPAEWMEWEKQYYTCYDDYICKVVGLLQSHLMNTRPSLALGMLALITMSVPATTVMIVLRLMEVANGVLSAVHLR